jgi:hypothetical protein
MVVSMHGAMSFIVRGIAALGLNTALVACAATDDSQPASSGDAATQPSHVLASPARRCGPSDVAIGLGRHGAWHGMTTQNVTVKNVRDEPCVLRVDDLRHVDVDFGDERSIEVDLRAVEGSRLLVRPGRDVSLMFGADASSADCGPIARTVRVRFAGAQPVELSGAWVAVGCERPAAIEGDDIIYASQHDRVFAGPGDDRIYGDHLEPGDVIHCGSGWDVVTTNDDVPGIVMRGCDKLRVEYAG